PAETTRFQFGSGAPMASGRPATSTTTTGTPDARSVLSMLVSVESRLIEPGRSPMPSAYGVSPITAIAARYEPSIPAPVALNVTVVDAATVLRMPCRIVVPVVVAPLAPCHEIVQPPVSRPRL